MNYELHFKVLFRGCSDLRQNSRLIDGCAPTQHSQSQSQKWAAKLNGIIKR